MYLYLGQDTVIKSDDIIGIFDIENTTVSKITKEYLSAAQKSGNIVEVSQEIPKSFVVLKGALKNSVYLSQISPATLKKRAYQLKDL